MKPDVASLNNVAVPETILQMTVRRFRAHRLAVVGVIVLVLVITYVIGGTFFYTERYANDTDFRHKWQGPSAGHRMGTDAQGRDVLARTIYGGQITIAISILAV